MGLMLLTIFILCAIYVQNRGKVAHASFKRRLTDHSNFLAPINCLFYAFSKVKGDPYVEIDKFPELNVLQENWKTIRDEALGLEEAAQIKAADGFEDIGFNSFFRTGWKRFYLKWYRSSLVSANELCPKTVEMLNNIPSVKGAMFASLPPGARLVKHRDPYAGSIRYHLGLVTPDSEDCFICVDGENYSWSDGEAVMFDETYIHFAENKTDQNRIVLFLDVKRPTTFFLVDWLNTVFSWVVLAASSAKNMEGDRVGFLNRAFRYLYQIRIVGKKIKAFNTYIYYGLQYSIYLVLIYFLFFVVL